jgi:hypothetical protein
METEAFHLGLTVDEKCSPLSMTLEKQMDSGHPGKNTSHFFSHWPSRGLFPVRVLQ